MIIEQEFTVDAPRDAVAAFFTDVQRVAGCVPGLEGVEETGPNQYSARLGVRMGPIRASFGGTLRLDPSEAPARLVAVGEGRDRATGSVATVRFTADLTEVSSLRPAGDHLVIEWWHPGDGPHSTKRF